jgi:hypothetical protein
MRQCAQNLSPSLLGKMLRIDVSRSPTTDLPPVVSGDPAPYNPFSVAGTATGNLGHRI